MNKPPKGPLGFESYYRQAYGERWQVLKSALLQPNRVARLNSFTALADPAVNNMMGQRYLPTDVTQARLADGTLTHRQRELSAWYVMDVASIAAPLPLRAHLDACEQPKVLDLCAAPGGKSLVLAELLWADDPKRAAQLVTNERSRARRARLTRVLGDYLPDNIRQRVQVTGHDATRWGLHESNLYDAVLLDAPCSSEGHVLADQKALGAWSLKRVTRLAAQQYAMVVAALTALKPGGILAYSTCSIARPENDGVIERLLKKKPDLASVLDVQWPDLDGATASRTRFGWHALPDMARAGPIYSAYLRKLHG